MKHKLRFAILMTSFLVGCQNKPQNPHEAETRIDSTKIKEQTSINIAEVTLKSTVAITMQDKYRQTFAMGSGAIVGIGLVITNLHVIAGASFGFIQLDNDQQKYNIEGYLAIDKINDLALLSIPTLTIEELKLQITLPKVGEKIFAAGNPQGLSGTFSEGIVSSLREFEGKQLIQITAPISPRSSGGPIVNDKTELVGIAVGGFTEGQNLNFAIPSKFVAELVKNKKEVVSLNIPKSNQLYGQTTSSKNVQTDIRNLVKIKNVFWESDEDEAINEDPTHLWPKPNMIYELTIYNGLSYPISNITIGIIIYDRSGMPSDYDVFTLLQYGKETILPGLGKTFCDANGECEGVRKIGFLTKVDKKLRYRYEIRLLDFKIHYDN